MHLDDKRKKEMETIHFMISLYCRKKHHHDGLCIKCEALYAVSYTHLDVYKRQDRWYTVVASGIDH